jgi:hypothetical protein
MRIFKHIVTDLQTALNLANTPSSFEVSVTGILNADTLYSLMFTLVDIRDYLYEFGHFDENNEFILGWSEEYKESMSIATGIELQLKPFQDEDSISDEHIPLLRKAVIDVLRAGYKDLKLNGLNATGFPDVYVYYEKKGSRRVNKPIDISGNTEFEKMWLSGVTNLVEMYVTIKSCGGLHNYKNFLEKEINYQGKPDTTAIRGIYLVPLYWYAKGGYYARKLTSEELETVDKEKIVIIERNSEKIKCIKYENEEYGKISSGGPAKRGTTVDYKSFKCPFWRQTIERGTVTREKEVNIHAKCRNNFERAMKAIFLHYADLRNYFSEKTSYTDVIKTVAPGLACQNGIMRQLKCKDTVSSFHMWLLAIDMDAERNAEIWSKPYARLSQPIYKPFIDIMRHYGFLSLGEHENWDWMHFQYAVWNNPQKNQSNAGDVPPSQTS